MQASKIVAVMSDGSATLTEAELETQSIQFANLLLTAGLKKGNRVAVLMENNLHWFVALMGIRRAGMMAVPVNWHLKSSEVRFILENSDSKAILSGDGQLPLASEAIEGNSNIVLRMTTGAAAHGFSSFSDEVAKQSDKPRLPEMDGGVMLYSGGTSGRPKGIIRTRSDVPFKTPTSVEALLTRLYGLAGDTIYLCPAPLYHAAPIGWTVATILAGGCVVVMRSFDPSDALRALEKWSVTHVQFVPTHMVRLLKLDEEVRASADLSSLRVVVHAAAPCPPTVKRQTIEWLGPIVYEYYSGSEGCGFTAIDSEDWLAHPGSVGRSERGPIHIIDPDTGEELPVGSIGLVFFELGEPFEYHKEPERTAECFTAEGWGTHGDLGRIDEEGYLYLVDRLSNMIISGGVNIYPQEIENLLISHPAIADVAAIGVPNDDFGEEVKAVVELTPEGRQSPPDPETIIQFCRDNLAHFKCPRSVDFVDALPRYPNGKLLKRDLRGRYWPAQNEKA